MRLSYLLERFSTSTFILTAVLAPFVGLSLLLQSITPVYAQGDDLDKQAVGARLSPPAAAELFRVLRGSNDKGRYKRAVAIVDRELAKSPDNRRLMRLRISLLCSDEYSYEEGVKEATRLIALYSDDPHFHYWRGRAYLEIEEPEKAIKDFRTAFKLDPQNHSSLEHLASAYYRAGNINEALLVANQAISLKPTDSFIYAVKAETLVAAKRWRDALRVLNEGVAKFPDSSKLKRTRIKYATKLKQWDLVIEDTTWFLKMPGQAGRDWHTSMRRADAYMALNKYKEAIADYSNALRIVPTYRPLFVNRAICYEKTGQSKLARMDKLKVKQLESEFVPFSATPDWTEQN